MGKGGEGGERQLELREERADGAGLGGGLEKVGCRGGEGEGAEGGGGGRGGRGLRSYLGGGAGMRG